MKEEQYIWVVQDKNTLDNISEEFDSKDEAEIWAEENAIDYDNFEIKRLPLLKL